MKDLSIKVASKIIPEHVCTLTVRDRELEFGLSFDDLISMINQLETIKRSVANVMLDHASRKLKEAQEYSDHISQHVAAFHASDKGE